MMAWPCSKVEAGTLGPGNSKTAEHRRARVRKQKGISGKNEQIKNTRSRRTIRENREVGRTENYGKVLCKGKSCN